MDIDLTRNEKDHTIRKNEKLITDAFYKIKTGGIDGFHRTSKPQNKQGAHGNTFEKLFSVDENNKKLPDYKNFEIKSMSHFQSKANISLSSKVPDYPKNCGVYLRDQYGHTDPKDGLRRLYVTLRGDGSWSHVHQKQAHVSEEGKFWMKIHIDREKEKMKVLIQDYQRKDIEEEIYWTFGSMKDWISKLKDKIIGECSEQKLINNVPYYYYKCAHVFWDLDFDKFLKNIEDGNIELDYRFGVYKEPHRRGKLHDRGSCLRLNKQKWLETCKDLYSEYKFLE